jgi:hypothetical protein
MENLNFIPYESHSEFEQFAKPGDIFWTGYNFINFNPENESALFEVQEVKQNGLIVTRLGQRKKLQFNANMRDQKVIKILHRTSDQKKGPQTKYKVEDYSGSTMNLLEDNSSIFEAKSNIDAARKYLKKNGITRKLERSADNDVQIKVQPFFIAENGQKYVHPTKRISWYRLV